MIPYFEKALCSVAQEIRHTLFFFILLKKIFNVDDYRVCLILFLLLLLLNIVVFSIS